MINLSVEIGGFKFKNPVMLASGTCGPEIKEFTDIKKLGAIITKSITLEHRIGNPPPRTTETIGGMLNSVGIENPGVDEFINQRLDKWLELGIPVIVSVAGKKEDEYCEVIKKLEQAPIIGFEINVSCPNVEGVEFGKDPCLLERLICAIKSVTKKLLIVKLSPNVSHIQRIALSAEQGGAHAISLINTIYGLKIDIQTKKPLLGRVTGGLSGPCIKPVALYYVYKVSQVCKIPIIGIGGIMSAQDALEFIIVGATAIEVGTANFVNPNTGVEIVEGIREYCREKKIKDIKEIIKSRNFE